MSSGSGPNRLGRVTLGLGAEQVGPGDDDLLAHADEQLCVVGQVGADQLKMLHHHPAALAQSVGDGLGQFANLGEAQLKAHVQMIGVGLIKADLVHAEQRQRPHVDAVVVVGHLQAGKHPLAQQALAAARLAPKGFRWRWPIRLPSSAMRRVPRGAKYTEYISRSLIPGMKKRAPLHSRFVHYNPRKAAASTQRKEKATSRNLTGKGLRWGFAPNPTREGSPSLDPAMADDAELR